MHAYFLFCFLSLRLFFFCSIFCLLLYPFILCSTHWSPHPPGCVDRHKPAPPPPNAPTGGSEEKSRLFGLSAVYSPGPESVPYPRPPPAIPPAAVALLGLSESINGEMRALSSTSLPLISSLGGGTSSCARLPPDDALFSFCVQDSAIPDEQCCPHSGASG